MLLISIQFSYLFLSFLNNLEKFILFWIIFLKGFILVKLSFFFKFDKKEKLNFF